MYAQEGLIFYQNDKIKLSLEKGGVNQTFNFKNFEENETVKVQFRVFNNSKVFLGSETFTENKKLIEQYRSKYLKMAVEKNRNMHDIEYDERKFKIVTEKSNNRIRFYYYHSKVNSKETVNQSCAKTYNNTSKSDWLYFGNTDFLIEISINDKIEVFKEYNLNKM
ncbi:hypothetical protein FCR2A7T_25870 [Flavobacterium cauense R2A-7]|uniref:Uncharacterized protein n=2 Tax=Flavobacterium TaxID=237 RepID=V6RYF2_9FLAO|nr:hypothetical protein FCR2A7T_25870 [Flavobacterium cauense R2A-7]KGO82208.1 hypothetical protein Q762_05845 [Flavobacterium cauense R2A-7]TWI15164.1 hypothetical protein IP98_00153 [Flavobacterium cauense R2A-7]